MAVEKRVARIVITSVMFAVNTHAMSVLRNVACVVLPCARIVLLASATADTSLVKIVLQIVMSVANGIVPIA